MLMHIGKPREKLKMKSITAAAANWFFVHVNHDQTGYVSHRIAAWGVNENDEPVGLIGNVQVGTQIIKAYRLVGVPPVPGMYRHYNDMTEAEKRSVTGGKAE